MVPAVAPNVAEGAGRVQSVPQFVPKPNNGTLSLTTKPGAQGPSALRGAVARPVQAARIGGVAQGVVSVHGTGATNSNTHNKSPAVNSNGVATVSLNPIPGAQGAAGVTPPAPGKTAKQGTQGSAIVGVGAPAQGQPVARPVVHQGVTAGPVAGGGVNGVHVQKVVGGTPSVVTPAQSGAAHVSGSGTVTEREVGGVQRVTSGAGGITAPVTAALSAGVASASPTISTSSIAKPTVASASVVTSVKSGSAQAVQVSNVTKGMHSSAPNSTSHTLAAVSARDTAVGVSWAVSEHVVAAKPSIAAQSAAITRTTGAPAPPNAIVSTFKQVGSAVMSARTQAGGSNGLHSHGAAKVAPIPGVNVSVTSGFPEVGEKRFADVSPEVLAAAARAAAAVAPTPPLKPGAPALSKAAAKSVTRALSGQVQAAAGRNVKAKAIHLKTGQDAVRIMPSSSAAGSNTPNRSIPVATAAVAHSTVAAGGAQEKLLGAKPIAIANGFIDGTSSVTPRTGLVQGNVGQERSATPQNTAGQSLIAKKFAPQSMAPQAAVKAEPLPVTPGKIEQSVATIVKAESAFVTPVKTKRITEFDSAVASAAAGAVAASGASTPAKGTPVKCNPAKGTPCKGIPAKGTPVKVTPSKGRMEVADESVLGRIPSGVSFGDGEHVTIWNCLEKRKIAGNAAPLGRNLVRYLREHTECEVYVSQDEDLGLKGSGRKRPKGNGNGEGVGAGEHIAIWNKTEKRKIAGNAAPLMKNLDAYLSKRPNCEVYRNQDEELKNNKSEKKKDGRNKDETKEETSEGTKEVGEEKGKVKAAPSGEAILTSIELNVSSSNEPDYWPDLGSSIDHNNHVMSMKTEYDHQADMLLHGNDNDIVSFCVVTDKPDVASDQLTLDIDKLICLDGDDDSKSEIFSIGQLPPLNNFEMTSPGVLNSS